MKTGTETRPIVNHSLPAAARLHGLLAGPGGQTLVVLAENSMSQSDVTEFPAGLRRVPAATALEAVLSFTAHDAGYDRIVVFSGMNEHHTGNHLPGNLKVGNGLIVGQYPGVWELRSQPESLQTDTSRPPNDQDSIGLKGLLGKMRRSIQTAIERRQVNQPGNRLEIFQGQRDWVEQIEAVLKRLDESLGLIFVNDSHVETPLPTARRTLLVLDEAVLIPGAHQFQSLQSLQNDPFKRKQVQDRLNSIPDRVSEKSVDLILLVRTRSNLSALRAGRFIQEDVLRGLYGDDERAPKSLPWFPGMQWRVEAAPDVTLSRLETDFSFDPHFQRNARYRSVADVLRNIPPQQPKAPVIRPAADPTTADLLFWSQIDIGGLRNRLIREVIGQRNVVDLVVAALAGFRQTCRDALNNGRLRLPAKKEYRPPMFLFLGESGMGKTHLAWVIADQLFGQAHFALILLTQKHAELELFGAPKGFIGYDHCPEFLKYCQNTGGKGLVVFDELDKVKRDNQSGRLDHATNPFLGPVEHWNLTPNNPKFTNAGDRAHFANTVLVFTANLLGDDVPFRPGYERLSELGGPLLGRITYQLEFERLKSEELLPAVQFFLTQYLNQLRDDVFCPLDVIIETGLADQLAREFDRATLNNPTDRTFRTLKGAFLPARLPPDPIKDKFRQQNMMVGRADTTGEWRPAFVTK